MRGATQCRVGAAIGAAMLGSIAAATGCVTAGRYESLAAQQQAAAAERDELREAQQALDEQLEQARKSRDELTDRLARTQREMQALRESCGGCSSVPR
jgi:uncharacterized coiled-coil DUF342 family protein